MIQSETDQKFKVLFVDDEQDLLDGLRQRLRKQRKIWSMSFICGASEALELARDTPFDAVISDMRMPGMDGATFLNEIRRIRPASLRLVLSGEADEDTITRALPAVHQWHAKPCDVETLAVTLQRSLEIRRAIGSSDVLSALGASDSLPPLPATYSEMLDLIEAGDPSPDKLAEIVARDPALSAKLLQISNSAFFGLPHRTTTVTEALRFVGTDTLSRLVLSTEVFESFSDAPLAEGFTLDRFLFRCTLVGHIAARLAPSERAGELFTLGLLHDIGLLLMAHRRPNAFERCIESFIAGNQPWHDLEIEHLGARHGEIGAALFASWGLPSIFVETAFCHAGEEALQAEDPARWIHTADALASELIDRDAGRRCALGGPIDLQRVPKDDRAQDLGTLRTIAEEEYLALREHHLDHLEGLS